MLPTFLLQPAELLPRQRQSQIKVERGRLPTFVAVNESNVLFCSGTDFLYSAGLEKKNPKKTGILNIPDNFSKFNSKNRHVDINKQPDYRNSASQPLKTQICFFCCQAGMMYNSCQRQVGKKKDKILWSSLFNLDYLLNPPT